MHGQNPLNWYGAAPGAGAAAGTTNAATAVDARVRGGLMCVCEFQGAQYDPEKKRRCKHYNKSNYRQCCQWFYEDIEVGHCGYAGP